MGRIERLRGKNLIKETAWTSDFLNGRKGKGGLRQLMPNCEIIKFNSYGGLVEGGIPDFCVVQTGYAPYSHAIWIEVKVVPSKNQMFKPLQLERLKRLGGWYLVWNTVSSNGRLFPADKYEHWHLYEPFTKKEIMEQIARMF